MPHTPDPFWRDLMTFGLGVLRLPPEAFWSMTPREFECAARAHLGDAAPMDAPALARLMRRFPDAMTGDSQKYGQE